MPDAQAKVKLTAKQQEVVNLMAAGYEMLWHPDMGRFAKASASLRRAGDYRNIASNIPEQLFDKGVVRRGESTFRSTEYMLTDAGKVMATAMQEPKTETWWSVGKKWRTNITPKQFSGSTECYLLWLGHKTAKDSEYETWYPTRDAAVKAMRSRLKDAVSNAAQALKSAQQELAKFEKQERKNA
jgi:hypothetical protein